MMDYDKVYKVAKCALYTTGAFGVSFWLVLCSLGIMKALELGGVSVSLAQFIMIAFAVFGLFIYAMAKGVVNLVVVRGDEES